MIIKIQAVIAGITTGLIIALISTYTIGYTAGIALPKGLSSWAKENDLLPTLMMFWDTFVVQLIGVGILAFILTYAISKFFTKHLWYSATAIFIGFAAFEYYMSTGVLNITHLPILSFWLVFIACVSGASYLSRSRS